MHPATGECWSTAEFAHKCPFDSMGGIALTISYKLNILLIGLVLGCFRVMGPTRKRVATTLETAHHVTAFELVLLYVRPRCLVSSLFSFVFSLLCFSALLCFVML